MTFTVCDETGKTRAVFPVFADARAYAKFLVFIGRAYATFILTPASSVVDTYDPADGLDAAARLDTAPANDGFWTPERVKQMASLMTDLEGGLRDDRH